MVFSSSLKEAGVVCMITKGKNQHVMPCADGWCVVDEVSQMVTFHFESRHEALAYANATACTCEGSVLVHRTPYHPGPVSTVRLPQQTILQAEAHINVRPKNYGRLCSDFDPFLGFDESYFEI